MPHLNENTLAPVTASSLATHKCKWVRPDDQVLAKYLHVCTHKFVKWNGTEPNWGLTYADYASYILGLGIAAEAAGDDNKWNQYFYDCDSLDSILVEVLPHVSKLPYETEAEWLDALRLAKDLADPGKLVLRSAGLVKCCDPTAVGDNSHPWEDEVTWGLIRRCPQGLRVAAVLERGRVVKRYMWSTNPAMVIGFDTAMRYERTDDTEDDDAIAYSVIRTIGSDMVLPPALRVYVPPTVERLQAMREEAYQSRSRFDGASAFCQERTDGIVRLHGGVLRDVLRGLNSADAINGALLEPTWLSVRSSTLRDSICSARRRRATELKLQGVKRNI